MLTKMKSDLAHVLSAPTGLTAEKIMELFEVPSDSLHGDLAFPCFGLAKTLRKSPNQIAKELTSVTLPISYTSSLATGGYLNFFFNPQTWQHLIFSEIQNKKESVGNSAEGLGKTVVIDYSSPNVAKPMSIGHLRSTVIGQSLANLFRAASYTVVGINYIGDWGVQFGKLAWAHQNLRELLNLAQKHEDAIVKEGFDEIFWKKLITDSQISGPITFDYLFAIYVIFHAVADYEPSLDDFGREYFLKLEQRTYHRDGLTDKIEKSWEEFIKVSMAEYKKVYGLLKTKHDLVRGESFYEEHLRDVVTALRSKKLLVESEGAQVVDLSAFEMPPCLIQKKDGATLYATRDLAAALNRKTEFKADKLLYVVGAEQTLHFRQVFKVLELMEYPWAKDCEHVGFGLYRFKEGKMSTRRGNVVLLEDVLDRAVEFVRDIIKQKNPDLLNAEVIAQSVGTGAVVFNDLMNDRQKNIDFDWDKLLDFNGDTGPYIQYTHVRCCSVLSKWKKELPSFEGTVLLKEPQEKNIFRTLGRFDDVVKIAREQLKPSWIAQYLLELSKAFNSFYYEHRILEGEIKLQESRIILTDSVRMVIAKGLTLLGIDTPHAM